MVKLITLTLAVVSIFKFGAVYAVVLHPFIALWLVLVLMIPQIASSVFWAASNALLAAFVHFAVALPLWRITLLGGFKSYTLAGYQLVQNYEATRYGWCLLAFVALVDFIFFFITHTILGFLLTNKDRD
ncbi:hypothetical protein [Microvirga flavescens]|uniref:hypothetical protein n=1 Tax=Microvirga flavescens TaxID=2249811 RepID=UPI000DD9F121|nr:hypothetical protein [Microvirga flavescens]